MSYCIYGLRIIGDPECRYVGLTSHGPETRLARHIAESRLYRRIPKAGLGKWLRDNAGNLEAFELGRVETKEEARATERQMAALCLCLNHRLFNKWLVPVERRIDWQPPNRFQRPASVAAA